MTDTMKSIGEQCDQAQLKFAEANDALKQIREKIGCE